MKVSAKYPSFKSCYVSLSKENNGDYTANNVVDKFNRTFPIKNRSELADKINFFIPAAGKGSRFKIAKLLGNYNKVNMPINLGKDEQIHLLDFIMKLGIPFSDKKGNQTIMEDSAKGSFSGIIKYYMDGNPVKDTVVCSSDSVFDDITDFTTKIVHNPNLHLVIIGGVKSPVAVNKRYGVMDVNTDTMSIRDFIEKPDIETAKKYVQNGYNYVNTGCYFISKDVMEKLLDEIKMGKNSIKKNEKEQYDFALAVKYINQNLSKWTGQPNENTTLVSVTDSWVDIGEPEGFYEFAEKVKKGKFLKGFPKNTALSIQRAFQRIFQLEQDIPYANFSDSAHISNEQLSNACDIDGIKIIV